MTFFSTLFNIKKSLMLADPVFNETHLQVPDFVEDDIDTERKKWEHNVYQIYVFIPDNLLHSLCWEKENSSPYDDCPCYMWQMQKQEASDHF